MNIPTDKDRYEFTQGLNSRAVAAEALAHYHSQI